MSRAKVLVGAFLLWTAIAFVFATQLYFAGLSWQQALSWTLPRWYSWGVVTPAIFWLDRRLAGTTTLPVRLGLHVPLGAIWTSVTILLRLVARPARGAVWPPDFSAYFLDRFYSDLPIYAVIAGISFARQYAAQVQRSTKEAHDMALRATDLERNLAEARLQSLRAQLQPHFLFNALNTISAFTESNPQMARRLMAQLGDLLRASLRHAAAPLVTLSEELTFLDDYLAIESARFEGRITVSVDIDDDVLAWRMPSFLLQPLVENAIRHGVAPRVGGGRVEVRGSRLSADLRLIVRDDGSGLPAGWTFSEHAGVGLRNVASRLEHLYGRSDLLTITPRPAGGVEVQVLVPAMSSSGSPA